MGSPSFSVGHDTTAEGGFLTVVPYLMSYPSTQLPSQIRRENILYTDLIKGLSTSSDINSYIAKRKP
jgi:hypothetical protein